MQNYPFTGEVINLTPETINELGLNPNNVDAKDIIIDEETLPLFAEKFQELYGISAGWSIIDDEKDGIEGVEIGDKVLVLETNDLYELVPNNTFESLPVKPKSAQWCSFG